MFSPLTRQNSVFATQPSLIEHQVLSTAALVVVLAASVVVDSSTIAVVVVGISVVSVSVALSTIVDVRSAVLSMTVAVEVASMVFPAKVVAGRQGPAFTVATRSTRARWKTASRLV